jgi:hypothetical protein
MCSYNLFGRYCAGSCPVVVTHVAAPRSPSAFRVLCVAVLHVMVRRVAAHAVLPVTAQSAPTTVPTEALKTGTPSTISVPDGSDSEHTSQLVVQQGSPLVLAPPDTVSVEPQEHSSSPVVVNAVAATITPLAVSSPVAARPAVTVTARSTSLSLPHPSSDNASHHPLVAAASAPAAITTFSHTTSTVGSSSSNNSSSNNNNNDSLEAAVRSAEDNIPAPAIPPPPVPFLTSVSAPLGGLHAASGIPRPMFPPVPRASLPTAAATSGSVELVFKTLHGRPLVSHKCSIDAAMEGPQALLAVRCLVAVGR